MRRLISIPVLSFILCAGAFAQQQSSDPYAPPPPPPQTPSTQPDKNCSSQAARGEKGSKTSSTCPPANKPDTPADLQTAPGVTQQPKKSTADDNPFPEDVSKRAEDEAKAREAAASKAAPAAAEGESSSREKLDKLDLESDRDSGTANGGIAHDPKLAADDVHVGQFYLNREDYKGAYARFKEATLADPENPDAIFYLAEAARRMNHRDEAAQNYQLYLTALPDGPKSKEARKALRDLSASAKH
jgi:tetratricopeptide (TPR) repeat protein